jgi:hypothetical protein
MTAIVLSPTQEKLLSGLTGEIPVTNSSGESVGVLFLRGSSNEDEPVSPTPEVLDELARRMNMPNIQWLTTDEVRERLKSLDAK